MKIKLELGCTPRPREVPKKKRKKSSACLRRSARLKDKEVKQNLLQDVSSVISHRWKVSNACDLESQVQMLTHDVPALVLTDTLSVTVSLAVVVDTDLVDCTAGRPQNKSYYYFFLPSFRGRYPSKLVYFSIFRHQSWPVGGVVGLYSHTSTDMSPVLFFRYIPLHLSLACL